MVVVWGCIQLPYLRWIKRSKAFIWNLLLDLTSLGSAMPVKLKAEPWGFPWFSLSPMLFIVFIGSIWKCFASHFGYGLLSKSITILIVSGWQSSNKHMSTRTIVTRILRLETTSKICFVPLPRSKGSFLFGSVRDFLGLGDVVLGAWLPPAVGTQVIILQQLCVLCVQDPGTACQWAVKLW